MLKLRNIDSIIKKLNLDGGYADAKNEYWFPCPLPYGNHKHGDQNPSFSLNLETGQYNCFVCGGGSLIKLISEIKGISYEEAKGWLHDPNEDADEFYERIQSYLANKTNKQEVNSAFNFPYYEDSVLEDLEHRPMHSWFVENGISRDTVLNFKLLYDPELPGIVFPHFWKGKLVGWQERDLNEVRKGPKYKNTPHFPKRNTLFNVDFVYSDDVIVVESPKTVCIMHSRGIENVVATFGAEVNYEQTQALWKFKKVTLWFDNDEAGYNATKRTISFLKNQVPLWVIPPIEEVAKGDPGDISPELMQEYLNKAMPYQIYERNYEKIYDE